MPLSTSSLLDGNLPGLPSYGVVYILKAPEKEKCSLARALSLLSPPHPPFSPSPPPSLPVDSTCTYGALFFFPLLTWQNG
jgi:hypothetical protein